MKSTQNILTAGALTLCLFCAPLSFARKKPVDIKTPEYFSINMKDILVLQRIILSDSATQIYVTLSTDSVSWNGTFNHDTWKLPETLFLAYPDAVLDGSQKKKLLRCDGYGTKDGVATTISMEQGKAYAIRPQKDKNVFVLNHFVMTFEAIPEDWEDFRLAGFENRNFTNRYEAFRYVSSNFDFKKIHARKQKYKPAIKKLHQENAMDSLPDWKPCIGRVIVRGRAFGGSNIGGSGYSIGTATLDDRLHEASEAEKQADANIGAYHYEFLDFVYPTRFAFSPYCFCSGYSMLVCPGDSITLDIDANRMTRWNKEKSSARNEKEAKKYSYTEEVNQNTSRWGGMPELDNLWLIYRQWEHSSMETFLAEAEKYKDEDFRGYTERAWQDHQKRLNDIRNKKLSPAQKEYLCLMSEWTYIRKYTYFVFNKDVKKRGGKPILSDERLEELSRSFTLSDPHAVELQLPHSCKGAYVIDFHKDAYNYLKENHLLDTPLGRWLSGLTKAQDLYKRIADGQAVTDESEWNGIDPIYLDLLKSKNEEMRTANP